MFYFIIIDIKDVSSKLVLNRVLKQAETSSRGLAAVSQNQVCQGARETGKSAAILKDNPTTHLLQMLSWGISAARRPHAPKSSARPPSQPSFLPHCWEMGSCTRDPGFSPCFIPPHDYRPCLLPTALPLNRWWVFRCQRAWCRAPRSGWEDPALLFTLQVISPPSAPISLMLLFLPLDW